MSLKTRLLFFVFIVRLHCYPEYPLDILDDMIHIYLFTLMSFIAIFPAQAHSMAPMDITVLLGGSLSITLIIYQGWKLIRRQPVPAHWVTAQQDR